ncbi:MAG: FAD-dependent oxidoreductase, partial [Nitrososphaerales archaeon]
LFTTRIREESSFKQAFRKLLPGNELTIMGPGPGGLALPDDSSGEVVFLGGGIGITPFRSMAKFATDTGLSHKITLLYSSKTAEDIVFRSEWKELQERNPNLKVVYTVTRPQEGNPKWNGRIGRIDSDFIRQNVKEIDRTYFYMAGPPALITALGGVLEDLKVESQKIQIEAFRGYI